MPTTSIKDGVHLAPHMAVSVAVHVVASIYHEAGYKCVLTAGMDGQHSRASLHYAGHALDFRTRHVPMPEMEELVAEIRDCLGTDFDVVLEPTHLHVEYQPKGER